MSNRLPPSVIKEMIKSAMDNAKESMDSFEGNENPSVKTLYVAAKARYESYRAVYDAMNGNTVSLRIDAQGV